jgi:hypothetical protein
LHGLLGRPVKYAFTTFMVVLVLLRGPSQRDLERGPLPGDGYPIAIRLPVENQCWRAVSTSPEDRRAVYERLLKALPGSTWEEVPRCPSDYVGYCAYGSFKPMSITTLYAYGLEDAEQLRRACLEQSPGDGSGPIWRWGSIL